MERIREGGGGGGGGGGGWSGGGGGDGGGGAAVRMQSVHQAGSMAMRTEARKDRGEEIAEERQRS